MIRITLDLRTEMSPAHVFHLIRENLPQGSNLEIIAGHGELIEPEVGDAAGR